MQLTRQRQNTSAGARGTRGIARTRVALVKLTLLVALGTANVASCRDFGVSDETSSGGVPGAAGSIAGAELAGHAGAMVELGGGGSSAGRAQGGARGGLDESVAGASGWAGHSSGGEGGSATAEGGSASADGGVGTGHGGEAGAAGGGSGAGAGPGDDNEVVAPSSLSGLSLWLESSPASFDTTDDRVWTWYDSSANYNDAFAFGSSSRPLLMPSGVNGLPALMFGAGLSNLEVSDDPSLQFGVEPFTIAFVGEWHNDSAPIVEDNGHVTYSGYGMILAKVAAAPPYDGVAIFANFASPYPTAPAQRRLGVQLEIGSASLVSTSTNLNDGKFRLYVVQRSVPGVLGERINGVPQGPADIPANIDCSAVGRSLLLGGEAGIPFQGSLAEVVIVKGAIDDARLRGLERYLMQKFGL